MATVPRASLRLAKKHIHPYVLCIIDMQPQGFSNATIVLENVLALVQDAISAKAFVVIAQYKLCGDTHDAIRTALQHYPFAAYVWHNKNDKSPRIRDILQQRRVLVRGFKVCGVNTEYCVFATVKGLSKKYYVSIKVIETACNGTDRSVATALQHMRTMYKNVVVV